MKCPKCNNDCNIAGKLPDGREIYYCKVCGWRGA